MPRARKDSSPSLIMARVESSRFTFEGVGLTKGQAFAALMDALRAHAKGYELPADWFKEMRLHDDVFYMTLSPGCGYRDHQQISKEG
jgi:hypothetical protein